MQDFALESAHGLVATMDMIAQASKAHGNKMKAIEQKIFRLFNMLHAIYCLAWDSSYCHIGTMKFCNHAGNGVQIFAFVGIPRYSALCQMVRGEAGFLSICRHGGSFGQGAEAKSGTGIEIASAFPFHLNSRRTK